MLTIYIDDNASSHFNAVKDGLRIYKLLFRQVGAFMGSSLVSAIVDYVMFLLLRWLIPGIMLVAVAGSRIVSSLFNYFVNREVVFKAKADHGSFIRYYMLVAAIMLLNYLGIMLLTNLFIPELLAKIIMDALLFVVSYRVQNKLVFKKK